MPKLYIFFIICCKTLYGTSANPDNQSISSEFVKLLDKFHQHDYKLDFGHFEVEHYNKQYVNVFSIVTFKYNRTCAAVNFTVEYKMDFGKGLEVVVQGYKFASNEYRLFPMRFQIDFCEAIASNAMGLGEYAVCGNFTGCPFPKRKTVRVCNWKPNPDHFPPFMTSGQYMWEFQGVYHSIEIWDVRAYGSVSRPIVVN